MSKDNWKPRLLVDIPEEEYVRMQRLLGYGTRKAVINVLLKQVLDLAEHGGALAIACLIDGRLGIGYNNMTEVEDDIRGHGSGPAEHERRATPGDDSEDPGGQEDFKDCEEDSYEGEESEDEY